MARYQLNHPKSYIGYAFAVAHAQTTDQSADDLTEQYITNGVNMARNGAEKLGLVDGQLLTERGEWLTDNPDWFHRDTRQGVLERFDSMRGARKRFVEAAPRFWDRSPGVAYGDPDIAKLAHVLEQGHQEQLEGGAQYQVTTYALFGHAWAFDAEWALDTFISDSQEVHDAILGDVDPAALDDHPFHDLNLSVLYANEYDGDKSIYRSSTTYQLKNVCWHLGIVQDKGTQARELDPIELTWGLEPDARDGHDLHEPASLNNWGRA